MTNKVRKFQVTPAIHYGVGAIDVIDDYAFNKVCIVTDQSCVQFGLLDLLKEVLDRNAVAYHIFDEVEPEPPLEIVAAGMAKLETERPEAIIAVGGGSVIDAAKAIMYFCQKSQGDAFVKPFFIALPTTAGTGSEVSEWSVVTDRANNTKCPIGDPMLIPDVALLDPRLLVSMPPHVTAETGMDALTHAIESFISTEQNPFARAQAGKAIALLFEYLPKAYHHGEDLEARANTQVAATMAAIAFTSSFLGIAHSIAHAIGSQWHLSHGLGNAMALPYVLAFNGNDPSTEASYRELLRMMGREIPVGKSATEVIVGMVFGINAEMGISLSLKDRGVSEEEYFSAKELLITKALADVCTPTNPIKATRENLGYVLDRVYYGR